MELLFIEIFVNAAVLCLILFLIAKHEADYSFQKVAMTTAGISLGSFLIHVFLFDKIGWYSLILMFAFSAIMIKTFCWISLGKTLIVIAIFCTFQIGGKVGIHLISQHFASPKLPPSQSEQAYEIAKEMGLIASPNDTQNPIPKPTEKPKTDKNKSKLPKLKNPFSKSEKKKIKSHNWDEARKTLIHGGTMLNSAGDYVAIVNGEIVEVDDVISHSMKSVTYRWKVTEISKHNTKFEQLDMKAK